MTDAEKQAECLRICGDAGKRGMHSLAPERLPDWTTSGRILN